MKVIVTVPVVLCKCPLMLATLCVILPLFSVADSAAVPGTCHTMFKTVCATIMNGEQYSPLAVKKAFDGTV